MENQPTDNRRRRSREGSGIDDTIRKVTRTNRIVGIIVAICMIVLGVLFLIRPVRSDIILVYLATIGFMIYGVYQIICYVRTPASHKNGWTLANGIIFVLLGTLILIADMASVLVTFTFLLSFIAIYSGVTQISNFAIMRRIAALGSGWMLASGILNIAIGAVFMFMPFLAPLYVAYVMGLYLIVGGVALFAEVASGHYGLRL